MHLIAETKEGAWSRGGSPGGRWPADWTDLACLALLYTATLHLTLVSHDGGRELPAILPALAVSMAVIPATMRTLARCSGWVRWTALAWVCGPLLSLCCAGVRAGWVRPVAVAALGLPVFLASLHLLRARRGETAILVLTALAALLAWNWAALVWYQGGTSTRGEPVWLAVAWHNQSGALMGALGVGALGAALARRGAMRLLSVLIAAAGLAGAWLAGSRGAALTTVAGGLVVVGAALRRPGFRSPIATTIATLGLTAIVVAGLSSVYAGVGVENQPLMSRSQDAGANARVRVEYWTAALRMAAAFPITGAGPGSYRWSATPFYPANRPWTAFAHSEQLEALAEQGILGGGAVSFVSIALALLVLRALRQVGRLTSQVAAAGVVTVLLGHSAIDFDWNYPILFVLLTIAAAVLVGSCETDPLPNKEAAGAVSSTVWLTITAAIGLLVIACLGIAVEMRNDPAPWDLDKRLSLAVQRAAMRDSAGVDRELALLRRWNPGAPRLPAVVALVRHFEGELDDEGLFRSLDPRRTAFVDQIQIIRRLLQVRRADLASELLARLRSGLAAERQRSVRGRVLTVASLTLDAAFLEGGCEAVRSRRDDVGRWAATLGVENLIEEGRNAPASSRAWMQCEPASNDRAS